MRSGQTYLPGSDVIFVSGVVMPSRPGRGGAGWPGECLCAGAGRAAACKQLLLLLTPAWTLGTQGEELGTICIQETSQQDASSREPVLVFIIIRYLCNYPSAHEQKWCLLLWM